MSIQLTKIGNSPNTPVREFICDTVEDIKKLPIAPMGSTAFVLSDKTVWMKGSIANENNGWVQL